MFKDVIVLAAGPSVKEYNLRDLEQRGHLISVNGASIYSKPHVAFTMDRLIAEHCYPIWQVQGTPEIWLRKGVMKKYKPGPNVVQFEHDAEKDDTLSFDLGKLNGANSGACAFNLAVQRATHRVFLVGFDMIRFDKECNPYWYPAFEWNKAGGTKDGNLKDWAQDFLKTAPVVYNRGIKVFNVNEPQTTRLTMFPIISYDKFKELTR